MDSVDLDPVGLEVAGVSPPSVLGVEAPEGKEENEAVPKPVDLIHWPGAAPNSKASLASKAKVIRA